MTAASPVRELLRLMIEVDGEEGVRSNFDQNEEFSGMVGPFEPRFCEWAYTMLEERRLSLALCNGILRAKEILQLTKLAGLAADDIEGLTTQTKLDLVLAKLGCPDPGLPPRLETGIVEIRRFADALVRDVPDGMKDIEGLDESPEGLSPSTRRGAERCLKLLVRFLWDAGHAQHLVAIANEGLHGFRKFCVSNASSPDWFEKFDLGSLNHLLRAFEKHRRANDIRLHFIVGDFWPSSVFSAFDKLAHSLNKEVHEGMAQAKRRALQRDSVDVVLCELDSPRFRAPRTVQFFREYRFQADGMAHLEGYTRDKEGRAELISFYEVDTPYELNKPYLFLSATNPSAVDAQFTPLPVHFTTAV